MSLLPLIAAHTGTPESSFGWKEILSVAGIVLPALFGLFLYLWKRGNDAQQALVTQKLEALGNSTKGLETAVQDLDRLVQNQRNECTTRYVMHNTYANDLQAQRDHLSTLKDLIKQQHDMVKDLVS